MQKSLYKKFLFLFIIGSVFGPIGDFFHVLTNTTAYPQSAYAFYIWLVPYWVFPLFGFATFGIGFTYFLAIKFLPRLYKPVIPDVKIIIFGLMLLVIMYSLSGFLPKPPGGVTDLIIWAVAVLAWLFLDRSLVALLIGILTAIVCSGVEIVLVRNNIFYYQENSINMFGIASWVPSLYFIGSVAVGNLSKKLFVIKRV